MQQIRAGPVEHRHEIITNTVDTFCREVAQTLLIDLYLVVAIRSAVFDGLYYWQRLDNTPSHAVAFNILT